MKFRAAKNPWNVLEAVGVVGVVAFLAWPFVGPQRYATAFDTYAYAGPGLKVTADAIKSGRIPGWTSDIFGGAPHLANPQMGSLSPMKLFALPFETSRGLGVLVALHLLVLGIGMLVLTRHSFRLPAPAGLVAASGVLLSGGTLIRMISAGQIDVLAWVPWVVITAVAVMRSQRPTRPAIGLAISIAMMLLGGHPQLAYICVPFIALAIAGQFLDHLTSSDLSVRWKSLGWIAIGGGMGVALALPQLLPSALILKDSAFAAGRDIQAVRNPGFVLHPRSLIIGAFGDLTTTNPVAITGSSETAFYLGSAVLCLAALGAWSVVRGKTNRWSVAVCVVCSVLGLVLSRGPAGLTYRTLFKFFPGFNQARVPGRWSVITVFGVSVLAAYGVAALVKKEVGTKHVVLALGSISVVVTLLILGPSPLPPVHFLVIWALFGVLAMWPVGRQSAGPRLALVPVAVVLVELLVPARFAPAHLVRQREPFTAYRDGLVAVMQGQSGRVLSLGHDKFDDPRYTASALRPNVNSLFALRSIDGYDGGPQVTNRWVQAMSALTPNLLNPELTLRSQLRLPLSGAQLARLGVRYALVETAAISAESQVPGWKGPVVTVGTAQVWENPNWRGEAQLWFSTLPRDRSETYAYLAAPESWGLESAIVELDEEALTCGGCSPKPAKLTRPHPGALDVVLTSKRPALLTVSEQFSPGWSVEIDGSQADPVEVDGFLLGTYVNSGSQTVTFRYTPPGLRFGFLGALSAVLLAAALFWREVRRSRLCKLDGRQAPTDF